MAAASFLLQVPPRIPLGLAQALHLHAQGGDLSAQARHLRDRRRDLAQPSSVPGKRVEDGLSSVDRRRSLGAFPGRGLLTLLGLLGEPCRRSLDRLDRRRGLRPAGRPGRADEHLQQPAGHPGVGDVAKQELQPPRGDRQRTGVGHPGVLDGLVLLPRGDRLQMQPGHHHRIHRLLERLLVVEAGQLDRCRTIPLTLVDRPLGPLVMHGEVDDHLLFADQEDHPDVLDPGVDVVGQTGTAAQRPPDHLEHGALTAQVLVAADHVEARAHGPAEVERLAHDHRLGRAVALLLETFDPGEPHLLDPQPNRCRDDSGAGDPGAAQDGLDLLLRHGPLQSLSDRSAQLAHDALLARLSRSRTRSAMGPMEVPSSVSA